MRCLAMVSGSRAYGVCYFYMGCVDIGRLGLPPGGLIVHGSVSAGSRGARAATGIEGLDTILGGGVTTNRLYLIEGTPGTGKTTLALQILLHGVQQGETGLYLTLSETCSELQAVAEAHGWSLAGLKVFEMVPEAGLDPEQEQTLLHPSEVELGETVRGVMERVEALKPRRVVLDSLSELRLLAQNALRYRRQILALKHYFSSCACTVFLLDDRTSQPGDLQLHSIAHGVISLDQTATGFGAERRQLRIVKMRGIKYSGGFHDMAIMTGGVRVYPRLIAADHPPTPVTDTAATGLAGLDSLLGGGLVPGTTTLLSGPAGVGKTTVTTRCMVSALERGERAAFFLFDERLPTLLARSRALGMALEPHIESKQLTIRQIDPAELSPGEFAVAVQNAEERDGAKLVVVDSLNAYLQAMPEDRHLTLQMHELLAYLGHQGVITLMVLGQHGLIGDIRSDIDLSYLADTVLLLRFFEAGGEVRKAISVVKTRTTDHERTIREFRVDATGLSVGAPLHQFHGIFSGSPIYRGDAEPLLDASPVAHSLGESSDGIRDE
jgi:circadian clock protein KaiC